MNHTQNKTATGCRPEQLFGLWMMEPTVLERYLEQANRVDLVALAKERIEAGVDLDWVMAEALGEEPRQDGGQTPQRPYKVDPSGIATIRISGPTTKYPTSFQSIFGGTSTVMVQRALREAAADPEVKAVMLHVEDAPGGTVAGSVEMYNAIREFAKAKPIESHVTDMGCSASYLYSAACDRVTANHTAHVGSIGVRAALVDTSKSFQQAGARVIPITTGKFKAIGMPGVEITPEQEAEYQKHIDQLGDMFIGQVATARKIDPAALRAMEARVYMAPEAKAKGLIDDVCAYEAARNAFAGRIDKDTRVTVTVPEPAYGSTDMNLLATMCAALGLNATATTEEQLAAHVRGMSGELATLRNEVKAAKEKSPVWASEEAVDDLCEAAEGRIDAMVAGNKIAPVVANAIKEQCGIPTAKGGARKPNPVMFAKFPQMENRRLVDVLLGVHAEASAKTVVPNDGPSAKVQPLPRQVPGGDLAAEQAAIVEQAKKDAEAFNKTNTPVGAK